MSAKVFHCRSLHLKAAWQNLTLKQRVHLEEMHHHYEREFAKLRDHPEQECVAVTIHDLVHEAVERQGKMTPITRARVACTRGCAACCKQSVTITKPEAVLLNLVAKHDGIPINWDLVERQAKLPSDDPQRWHEQPIEDRACVFLDANNDCMVYAFRPMACRKHFVVDDPDQCDIVKHPGAKTLNWVALEAEVLMSAAITVFDAGNLPVMLKRSAHQELGDRGVAEE